MYRAGSTRSIHTEDYELELGGHTVYPGSKVNVKWKGAWYDGTVTKIGPRTLMCKVRDLASNHTLLLERDELKQLDSALDTSLSPGTRVAYNDGEVWSEGVVEGNSCTGAALVSWRQSIYTADKETWFELTDLAPVIHNEAYQADEDILQASKSGLLQNNAIEPRPREMENVLYQSEDSDAVLPEISRARTNLKRDEPFYHVLDENQPPQHRIPLTGAHHYETIDEATEEKRHHSPKSHRSRHSSKHHTTERKHKSPSHEPSHGYDYPYHSLQHGHTPSHPHIPTPPHPHYPPPFIAGPWGMYQSFPYMQMPMYPPRRPLSPVKLPPNKTIEQTSLPCAWSYTAHYRNGIPPHSTSTFFSHMWGKLSAPVRNRSKIMPRKLSTPAKDLTNLKKSPSNISKAASEPPYGNSLPGYLATVDAIPRRDVPGKSLLRKNKEKSPKRVKIEEKTLQKIPRIEEEPLDMDSPLPYEVPMQKQDLSTKHITETAADKEPKKAASKKKKEKEKSPKGKVDKKDTAKALTIASSSPPEVSINTGSTALLTCQATGGNKLTYEWHKDKDKLPHKSHSNLVITAPGILEVRKCTPSDEGLYSCTVSNKWGTSNRSFYLTVVGDISRATSSRTGFPSSPQVVVPAGGEISPLQLSFNNKVTPEELELQLDLPTAEDGAHAPVSVQEYLDSLLEDIHIDDKEFDVSDYSLFEREQRPPGDGKESADTVPPLPEIVISEHSKSTRNKRRISNAIKNDNEDYLEGYGEDYGAISSATNLDEEGLKRFKDKDIAEKLKERDRKKTPKEKKRINFPWSRKRSKEKKVSDDDVPIEYKEVPSPTRVTFEPPAAIDDSKKRDSAQSGEMEVNSLGVNTSLGSEVSENILVEQLIRQGGGERLELPTEEESIAQQIQRLQDSVQEFNQDEPKGKKKGGVFGFKKRTKS